MFYRSPLLRVAFGIIGLWVSYELAFGGRRWHSAASLRKVEELGLPWAFWAVLFLIYAALMFNQRMRWAGYFLGMGLYGYFLISLFFTFNQGGPLNPVAIAAYLAAVVFHFAAARLAMLDRGR